MLKLKFFENGEGATVGDLYRDEQQLLATTHPATIMAAIFALDEYELTVETGRGDCQLDLPAEVEDGLEPFSISESEDMQNFMRGIIAFSSVNFKSPASRDRNADIHFRIAVHHLPVELIKVKPATPAPKNWATLLRERNQYIYFPLC